MESIVYAVDWNQFKENVYGGAAWLGGSGGTEVIEQLRKPTTLVCSSKGAEKTAMAGGRAKRDALLLDIIRSTIETGGTVLIPTDTSARVLELAYVLEHAWRNEVSESNGGSPFKSAKLYLASRNAGTTMRFARSMLEWMDESVVREFESEMASTNNKQYKRGEKQNHPQNAFQQQAGKPAAPFEFRHLRMLETRKQITKALASRGPRVVLASDTSLEWGFSKDIFSGISGDPNNLIVLTEDLGSSRPLTEGRSTPKETLWQWYQERKVQSTTSLGSEGSTLEKISADGKKLHLVDAQRVSLEGTELSIYQQYLATQRQAQDFSQLNQATNLENPADAVDEASSSSSSSDEDSNPEKQGKALITTAKAARFNKSRTEPSKEALGVNVLLRYQGIYDYDVRGKKGRDQMFPYVTKRRRIDDFGDLIKPEDYLRAEERDDHDSQNAQYSENGKREGLGQKRRWQETGLQGEKSREGLNGRNKKQQREKVYLDGIPADENGKARSNPFQEDEDSYSESEPEAEIAVTGPAKLEVKTYSVEVQLKIAFVDYMGIHDQRSLSMLIPLIQPKKLVLIGGDVSETRHLANDSRPKLQVDSNRETDGENDFIFTPAVGQMVDASVDTNAWVVKLSEALTKQLQWQNVKGLGVVTLAGHLAGTFPESPDSEEVNSRKKLRLRTQHAGEEKPTTVPTLPEATSTAHQVPVLDVLPVNMAAATRSMVQPLHVGDLRLADLRKILQSTGHAAEFRGEGTLLIDGLVAVRKTGTGKIEVEGGVVNSSDSRTQAWEGPFHAVKQRIYDGLAVIAGG